MTEAQQMFVGIMFFYILLSYLIMPAIFFYLVDKSLKSAGNGFIMGSLVSIVLWVGFGSKMVH